MKMKKLKFREKKAEENKEMRTEENKEENKEMKAEILNKPAISMILGGVCALLVLFMFGYCGVKINNLQNRVAEQQKLIENSRKVYVYNMEEVLKGTDIIAVKRKFEDEVLKLNDEVFATEKKIKSIKDEKMKKDLSDMYLKNLKMKRDDLMAKYQNDVKNLTDKFNVVISEIAKEKDVSVIFVKDAIAVKTPHVVDVTAEVLERIKNK